MKTPYRGLAHALAAQTFPVDGHETHQLKLFDRKTPFFNLLQYYVMSAITGAGSAPTTSTIVNQIARICHETNASYCDSIGDHTQTSWDEAPDWQRESAIRGVQFHLTNPGAGADASHNSWMAEKQITGWVYGPVKDADLKQHPCMVPYEQLPFEQKIKDYLFRGVVHAFLDAGADLG